MRIMDKKGISYIELIISIVLFVSFVAALFVFMNPVKQPNLSEVILNSVQLKLEDNVTILAFEFPFQVKDAPPCFKASVSGSNFKTILESNNIEYEKTKMFIEDDYGNTVNFELVDGTVQINHQGTSSIYHLFFSNETTFTTQVSGCPPAQNPSTLTPSTARSFTIFSRNRIKNFNDTYYNDYTNLKKMLDVPDFNDFAIQIYNETDIFYDMSREIPKSVIVQAREYPISMLDEITTKRIKGFINIKVW